MTTFLAYDGTELAYHIRGDGPPVACIPGGPMQDPAYLGDLGGLPGRRAVLVLHLRGTGDSSAPADAASYRCDRLVDDLEALREHLGVDRLDLLGHSAGTNLAMLYAARHPDRVRRLALITPSTMAVGIAASSETRIATARLREREPWVAESFSALRALIAGDAVEDARAALDPFFYGRWDTAARVHAAAKDDQQNPVAAAAFAAEGAFDPDTTRAALGGLTSPVLVLAGEVDLNSPPPVVARLTEVFPAAELVVQPGAGHFPWIDDAERFVTTTSEFFA